MNQRTLRRALASTIAIAGAASVVVLWTLAHAAPTPSIGVTVGSSSVIIGQTTSVDVVTSSLPARGLGGYGFDLNWDPGIGEYDVGSDTQCNAGDPAFWNFPVTAPQTPPSDAPYTITCAHLPLPAASNGPGASGSVTLSHLLFRCLHDGTINFTLGPTTSMFDADGNGLSVAAGTANIVCGTRVSTSPTPTATATLIATDTPIATNTTTPVASDTPANTQTSTPRPVNSPMPSAPTGTPAATDIYRSTNTPTDTPPPTTSPTPQGLRGDVDCNQRVDPVDATLILQLDAGMVPHLLCPQNGDVNHDGRVNSIDASIILQYDASIIHSLAAQNAVHSDLRALKW